MSKSPAFARADEIIHSLQRMADLCEDPTPVVYRRLFARHPEMQPYFWRDSNGAIKGEMLSRTFSAILDFVGDRHYAGHMIGAEMVTHEGYDVPRETFATFFSVIRDAAEEVLGAEWTPTLSGAWAEMLAEIDRFARQVPRTDVVSPYFAPRLEAFQKGMA